jgi:hypothetical protein
VSANTACTRTRLAVAITTPEGKSPEREVTRLASSASRQWPLAARSRREFADP